MTFRDDDRGASTTVTHALAIGISSLLVLTLLFGLGGFLEGQEKKAADRQLRTIGERVTTELSNAAEYSVADPTTVSDDSTVRLRVTHPERAAGGSYQIELEQTNCVSGPPNPDPGCVAVTLTGEFSATITVDIEYGSDIVIDGGRQVTGGGEFVIVVTPDGTGAYEVSLEK